MLAKRILLVIALGLSLFKPLYAIDGDYNIPYTDNYGYVYDPATGTYVKTETPAPVAGTDHQTAQSTGENVSEIQQPAPASSPKLPPDEAKITRLPFIIAALITIFGIGIVIVRKQKASHRQ